MRVKTKKVPYLVISPLCSFVHYKEEVVIEESKLRRIFKVLKTATSILLLTSFVFCIYVILTSDEKYDFFSCGIVMGISLTYFIFKFNEEFKNIQ